MPARSIASAKPVAEGWDQNGSIARAVNWSERMALQRRRARSSESGARRAGSDPRPFTCQTHMCQGHGGQHLEQ
jgi:hypothetical protein